MSRFGRPFRYRYREEHLPDRAMTRRRFPVALCLLAVSAALSAAPARAQAPRLVIPSPLAASGDADWFGYNVAAVPDVNADGAADLLVTDARAVVGGVVSGQAYVFSGADGALLFTLDSPNPQSFGQFGSSADAADFDGDGTADVAVGARSETHGESRGAVHVFSGATGALAQTIANPGAASSDFGDVVRAVPDLDGDGRPDLAIADPFFDVGGGVGAGRVTLYSGATGATIRVLDSPAPSRGFGGSIAVLPDVDGDGVADLAVGAQSEDEGIGHAYVFSGATGALLLSLSNPDPASFGFGLAVEAAPDLDGDGRADVYVSSDRAWGSGSALRKTGVIYAFSSATGDLLETLTNPTVHSRREEERGGYGRALASADLDGDGVPDLLASFPDEAFETVEIMGRAFVVSGATQRPLLSLEGQRPTECKEFGAYDGVAALGDTDGDGRPDIAVNAGCNEVYVYSGTVLDPRPADPAVTATSRIPSPVQEPMARVGRRLSALSTSGGSDHLLVASRVNIGMSRTHVLDGLSGTVLRTLEHAAFDGSDDSDVPMPTGIPDLTGDGEGDLLVGGGSPMSGLVMAYGSGSEPIATYEPASSSNSGIRGVAAAARQAGGAVAEAVIGDPMRGNSAAGAFAAGAVDVHGVGGGAPTATLLSPNPARFGSFGIALATTPEQHLLVGAMGEAVGDHTAAGRAYLFDGAALAPIRELVSPRPAAHGWFGCAATTLPDADGDGTADLLVGACREPAGGAAQAGRAYVFSGATGALLHELESPSPQAGGGFGYAVAGADVDGDGDGDAIVGAYREDAGGVRQAGRVYVFDGGTGALLSAVRSGQPEPNGAFGLGLAVLTASGSPELVVGAPGEDQAAGALYALAPGVSTAPGTPGAGVAMFPNPASGDATLAVVLPTARPLRIDVLDALGRRVRVLHSGHSAAGAHRWTVPLSGLPPGVYVVRVAEEDGQAVTRRVVVLR
jgi:hypothetical protein